MGEAPARKLNAISVDVEDYFQVEAFAQLIARESWESLPCRVEANVERILAQFEAAGVHGTFFTLGWIADRAPGLIRRIVAGGHELASHGQNHQRADRQDDATFREDVVRAMLRRFAAAEGQPAVFYFHPWEVDPGQPRVEGSSRMARFRHYINLSATSGRIDALLRDFAWDRMDRVFAHLLAEPGASEKISELAA